MPINHSHCILLIMSERTIFHIDMDAFFASVEVIKNPSLKGKAVIVGGNPNQRGVVSTCSYEARAYGVRSSMSLFEAKKRCPHAIFLDVNFPLYREYSRMIFDIFYEFTPHVEIVSVDEAYLDVSALIKDGLTPTHLGGLIKKHVFEKTKLPCSIGIGANKLIAKIASSLAKPNGIYDVPTGHEAAFLAPLPIQSIPGIGTKTQKVLNEEGFHIIRDLQALSLDECIHRYGHWGYIMYQEIRGKDNRPVVCEDSAPKSIGAETTFDVDISDRNDLSLALGNLVEKAWKRLRRHKMRTRGFSLKMRDSNFKTITRSATFYTHINDQGVILDNVLDLFHRIYQQETPMRLLGVSLEKLTESYWQPTFWD